VGSCTSAQCGDYIQSAVFFFSGYKQCWLRSEFIKSNETSRYRKDRSAVWNQPKGLSKPSNMADVCVPLKKGQGKETNTIQTPDESRFKVDFVLFLFFNLHSINFFCADCWLFFGVILFEDRKHFKAGSLKMHFLR